MFIFYIDTNKYTIYNKDMVEGVKNMKKEMVKNLAGVILFLLLFVVGSIAMNARVEQIEETSIVCS